MTHHLKALAAALLAACALPAWAQMEQTTLAIPVLSLTFSPNYIAEEKGFWKEEGLDVKIQAIPGVQATNAVLAGSVDFTNTASSAFLRANARGQKVVAIANTLEKVQVEIVVSKAFLDKKGFDPNAPIEKRAAFLKGARIAIDAPNSITHGYVKYAAKKGGIDPERDVTVSPMAPPAMLAAIRSGQVDGLSMSRPWASILRKEGIALTVASTPLGDFPELNPFNYNLIITKPGFCESKPSVCRKLINGFKKALAFMHDKPEETAAILRKKFDKTDPALVDDALKAVIEGTPRSPVVKEEGFASAQNYMLSAGVMRPEEKLASFAGLYTNEYAK